MYRRRVLSLILASIGLLAGAASAHGPAAARYSGATEHCAPARAVWTPGHRERVERRRWVPGGTRREWVPAVTRRVCGPWGVVREVVVRPGHWVLVPLPGHYETWYEEVWVPGQWSRSPR